MAASSAVASPRRSPRSGPGRLRGAGAQDRPLRGRATLGTWLYRIAVNAAVGRRRDTRALTPAPMDLDRVPARERGPAACETRMWITRAIDGLPHHYRIILLLRDVEGLSNDEVAAGFAESTGSVKSRLHRARRALRPARRERPGLLC